LEDHGGVLRLLPVYPSRYSLLQVTNTDVAYPHYCRSCPLSQLTRTLRHDLSTRETPPQDPQFPRRRRETLLSRITEHNPSWWAITGFEDLGPRGVPRGNQPPLGSAKPRRNRRVNGDNRRPLPGTDVRVYPRLGCPSKPYRGQRKTRTQGRPWHLRLVRPNAVSNMLTWPSAD